MEAPTGSRGSGRAHTLTPPTRPEVLGTQDPGRVCGQGRPEDWHWHQVGPASRIRPPDGARQPLEEHLETWVTSPTEGSWPRLTGRSPAEGHAQGHLARQQKLLPLCARVSSLGCPRTPGCRGHHSSKTGAGGGSSPLPGLPGLSQLHWVGNIRRTRDQTRSPPLACPLSSLPSHLLK